MRSEDVFWVAFWAGAGALFYEADRHDWPLCGTVRHLFRTDTTLGRLAFTGTLGAGTLILHGHILKAAAESSS